MNNPLYQHMYTRKQTRTRTHLERELVKRVDLLEVVENEV